MKSLCVIVPSRGRPRQFTEFLEAWQKTITDDFMVTTRLFVVLDEDDPTLEQYDMSGVVGGVHVGPRRGLMPSVNDWAVGLTEHFDIIGHLGDDHHPRTPDWDLRVRAALERPGLAFGDDLFQSKSNHMPTHVFMSSEIVCELGRMTCPDVRHFGDSYWKYLGLESGTLRFLEDCVFEHMHAGNGKATQDETYAAGGMNWDLHASDMAAWAAHQNSGRFAEDVAKIKALL